MSLVAMYGHCDSFDVTYTKINENLWITDVPPDLSDGRYIVDIYGLDETGYIAYWTGILYMFDSRVVMLELMCDCGGLFWDSTDEIEFHASLVQTYRKGGCAT